MGVESLNRRIGFAVSDSWRASRTKIRRAVASERRPPSLSAPVATKVNAIKTANGQVRVSFTPGANNGSAITSYTATCTSSNGGVTGTRSGRASPLTVTNLTTAKTCTLHRQGHQRTRIEPALTILRAMSPPKPRIHYPNTSDVARHPRAHSVPEVPA